MEALAESAHNEKTNCNFNHYKVFGFIYVVEYTGDNAVYRMEQIIKQLKGHTGDAFHGIFVSTGRAKQLLQRKRTNLSFPQRVQAYMAPPEEGSS